MSRIGRLPILIPAGVTVSVNSDIVTVSGPKGTLTLKTPLKIAVGQKDGQIIVSRLSEDKKVRSNHGSIRAHINNMIQGVQIPWHKELLIKGTGYKAVLSGNKLTVSAGYIHPVEVIAPVGIQFQVFEDTKVTISGPDKTIVGQVASNIRKIRTPEPYKGKGIRYENEFIKLKAGKTAKA